MLSHALKLIWNRRRANRLVVVEIAAAFVVTFVLISLAVDLWSKYRRPLGFEYENVWSVDVRNESVGGGFAFGINADDLAETLEDVQGALRALPRTVAAEPIMAPPFINFSWGTSFGAEADRMIGTFVTRTSAEALQAVGVTLVEGRWFGPEDEGQDYRAAIVNRRFAELAFGPDRSPVGSRINFPDPAFEERLKLLPEAQAREAAREVRVVGVIEDFRQHGEFRDVVPYAIMRHEPNDASGASFNLLLKVAAGTGASFEEDVVATVESVAPGWVASVTPWEQLRAERHADTLLPLKAGTTIASFFLVLVVMGLIGVLWQDVVRRTQEIGLRRALGASASAVRRQIQLEMLVVGVFGVLIGTAIAIQFPLLELVAQIDWASGVPGILLSAVSILLLVLLGALYPSWLASRREPADALRYE